MDKPTDKQVSFATEIAETIGDDLPEEYSKQAYSKFINSNKREYYRVKGGLKYVLGKDEAWNNQIWSGFQ